MEPITLAVAVLLNGIKAQFGHARGMRDYQNYAGEQQAKKSSLMHHFNTILEPLELPGLHSGSPAYAGWQTY